MNSTTLEERNRIFDTIILERRTHRKFKDDDVPDSTIMEIIQAGLHAPYAAAAGTGDKEYFRQFFVIRKDSETMKKIKHFFFTRWKQWRPNLKRLQLEMMNLGILQEDSSSVLP